MKQISRTTDQWRKVLRRFSVSSDSHADQIIEFYGLEIRDFQYLSTFDIWCLVDDWYFMRTQSQCPDCGKWMPNDGACESCERGHWLFD